MKNKPVIFLILLTLCIGSSYLVYRLFAKSGRLSEDSFLEGDIWSFDTNGLVIATPMLINDDIIIRTNEKILALRRYDGNIDWEVRSRAYNEFSDSQVIRSYVVANSQYVITGEESNSIGIYAAPTGRLLGSMEPNASFITDMELVDNRLIVARHDENLTVYDLDSKRKLWETKVPVRTNLSLVANSKVVVLAADRFLRMYDLKSGELLETISYEHATTGELIIDESTLFLSYAREGGDWSVTSLQLDSFAENWTYHIGNVVHPYLSVAGNQLYLYNQILISLDKKTGELLWKEGSQDIYSMPVAYDGNLFFVSFRGMLDKNLCKLDTEIGKLETCVTLEKVGPLSSRQDVVAPLLVDDMLVIVQMSKVIAFRVPK